jgi:TRAP-type mannitol/chloroaromatic compound transport system substrate-binding protein
MKRRDFVRTAATGAVGGGLLAGCSSESSSGNGPAIQTSPRLNWRLASSFPRSSDIIYGAAELLSERVAALTDDRFRIRVYPGGELVPSFQVLDAVQQGTVQMGHSASYYFNGKHPALIFDASVPFGLTARQQNAWLYYGGGMELMRELFGQFNIVNLPGGNTGAQMGGWFRNEINTRDDLNGLKMRIPGIGGEVMDRLGVTVQVLPGGEVYLSLERGAIDAAEWIGPYDDERLGLHEVADYYYYPGWWEPGPGLSFYINRDQWEQLPSLYREALSTAAAEANMHMLAEYDAKNPRALASIMESGVELRRFSDDIMQAAREETRAALEDQASNNQMFRKIYDSWSEFREESHRWFATAELGYADFAYRQQADFTS